MSANLKISHIESDNNNLSLPTIEWLKQHIKKGDALLFDMDGTLVDTDRCNTRAYKVAISEIVGEKYANELDVVRINRTTLREKLSWLSNDELSRIVELKEDLYIQFIEDVTIVPYSLSILKSFSTANTIVLTTNARQNRVLQTIGHLCLKDYFDDIITRDDCNKKNKFSTAIDKHHFNPDKVWVFENEKVQVEMAVEVGIKHKQIILI